jgi:hypothetical protein
MSVSELKLIKRCAEFRPREELKIVPPHIRGIYALLRYRPRLHKYDVVYIGMAGGSIRGRLRSHSCSKRKGEIWTHFSIFEVWENVREEEVKELEGILRYIYRKDTRANRLNVQRSFKKLTKVRLNNLKEWVIQG